jgi:hypothetical protein
MDKLLEHAQTGAWLAQDRHPLVSPYQSQKLTWKKATTLLAK